MLLSQREWADELDDDKWYPTYMGVGAGVSSGTYLMLGNRSDTIPLKSFKSSTKNLGTFTSLMARNTISSCQEKTYYIKPLNLIKFWGLWLFLYWFQKHWFFSSLPRSCRRTVSWGFRRRRWQTLQLSYQSHNDPDNRTQHISKHP